MAQKFDITIEQNRSFGWGGTVEGVDLTGGTIYFTVKPQYDDDPTDTNAIIKKDITNFADPTTGEFEIILTPNDTMVDIGKFVYDVSLKKSNGDKVTLTYGKCKVTPSATLRT